jgi:DNA/RNA endonuclease G (NUC1)
MPIPRWATHSASFCLGAALATVAQTLLSRSDEKSDTSSTSVEKTSISTNVSQPIKMMPSLPIRIYQPNPNLLIAFDTRTKNPSFVMEHLTSKSIHTIDKANRKNKRFYEEQSLPPYLRSRAHHYRNSGYDRGHLAPAADYPSENEMQDTFCLTNVSPQYASLNRGMWLRLEDLVRGVVKAVGKEESVWVVTGPLWLPGTVKKNSFGVEEFGYAYDGIGHVPSLVAVPTHFFKVILVVSNDEGNHSQSGCRLKRFAAFVLPNNELLPGDEKEQDCLMNYAVRLTDLEAVSGLEFFPDVMGSYTHNAEDVLPLEKVIADALTDDLRFQSKSRRIQQGGGVNSNVLVPISKEEELSKGRQRKIKQIIRDNPNIPYQHLCKDNSACFKMFSA